MVVLSLVACGKPEETNGAACYVGFKDIYYYSIHDDRLIIMIANTGNSYTYSIKGKSGKYYRIKDTAGDISYMRTEGLRMGFGPTKKDADTFFNALKCESMED